MWNNAFDLPKQCIRNEEKKPKRELNEEERMKTKQQTRGHSMNSDKRYVPTIGRLRLDGVRYVAHALRPFTSTVL